MLEKIIDTPHFNAVVKGRHGHIVFNKNDIYIGKAIEKYGEFSEKEVELFKQVCKQDDVIVDVGANIGTHTIVFSEIVGKQGRVYAYEPQRIIFQTLCANMAINSIENVECYQIAIASEKGSVLVPDLDYNIENNFGAIDIGACQSGSKAPKATLDQLLDLSRLDFIKIDATNMEYDIVDGAKNLIKKHTPRLYVQNDKEEQSKKLIELIKGFGYKLFWHLPSYFNLNNYAIDSENIYVGQASVSMLCIHSSDEAIIEGFQEITDSESHPLFKENNQKKTS